MSTTRRWWTFAVVSIALFMAMLDNLVVTTALPSIQRALHAGVSDLEWTINAYTLAFAVLMIPAAALGDRFGRRRVLLLGVALFTTGSALAALSNSATALTFARALQGVGAAGIMPLTLTILTAAFPPEKRAAAIGLWSGVSGLGLAAGPLVGGAIVSGWSWNAVFWINVPIGIALLVLGRMQLEESHGEIQPLDFPGIALIGGGLLGIVYGLVRGNNLGWSSIEILGALVAGTVLTIAFLVRERTARHPMLDLALFGSRGFSVSNAVGFLMSFGMFGSIFLLTLFIQNVLHFSPFRAGLGTMPWTATIMLVAPFAGIVAGRIGARPLVLLGMAAQAGALLWIGLLATTTVSYPTLLPAFILGGLGMGLTFAPLSEAVMASTAESRQGQASGAYNTIRELGGVFGIAVLGAVFQHIVILPSDFVSGFRAAVFAGAGIVAIGVLLAILLPRATAGAAATEQAEPEATRQAALAGTNAA
jgi:EmrB/QacA subfamily drug resistance transporter